MWIKRNWKILKEMAIPDHLRNVCAGQKAIVRTADCFTIGKGVQQEYILSSCLFNFCAEYTMQTAKLDESQAGIKIAGRNINNLRYADGIIMMVQIEEEVKMLLMRVKESEKVGLKLNIKKKKKDKDHVIQSHHFMANRKGESGNSDILFSWAPKSLWMVTSAIRLKDTCFLGKNSYDKTRQCIKKQRHHFANKGPYNQSYGFSRSHVPM